MMKKDDKAAADILSSVLSIDPGNTEANWLMAQYHLIKKWFILALVYLFEIIKHKRYTDDITEERVRETIADTFIETGEYEKALQQFYEMKKNDFLSASNYKKMINLALRLGDVSEARKLAMEAGEAHPDDGEFNYLVAVGEYEQKNYPEAIHELEEAEKKSYRGNDAVLLAGKIYFLMQDYEKAVQTFRHLPKEYLDSDEIEQFMGQAFYYLKDYTNAIAILEKTANHIDIDDPHLNETLFLLGCAYEQMGNFDSAITSWKRIDQSAAEYRSAADEKITFYTTIATNQLERTIVSESADDFFTRCEKLLTTLDFSVKRKVYQDDRNFEIICTNRQDSFMSYQYYITFSRQSSPASGSFIKEKLFRKTANRVRSLIIIAPWYSPEAEQTAKDQDTALYTLDIFRKQKLTK
jgi:tetratricopeptide (TPR) repeat protein